MKRNRLIYFLLPFLLLKLTVGWANNQPMTLALQNTSLPESIQLLAKMLHLNVIVSPSVTGVVNLHFEQATPSVALDMLLTANGLIKWRRGNIWWIGQQEELIKRKQADLKWQTITDETEKMRLQIWSLRYAQAQEVAQLLQNQSGSFVSKRGRVHVDTRTNVIFVEDIPEQITKMHAVIKQLDVPVQQVRIAARLAGVDSDFEQELGIDFQVKQPHEENSQNENGKSATRHYSLAVATLADGALLDVKLSALENAGHAEIISSPSLFAANQQTASIEAGEEVPYQEVSESGGTAVVFKKAVLSLKVTPQILPGNKVLLQLQINQDRPNSKTVLGMPTISTRQIVTSVLVKNGQTIVLGGIYETKKENAQQRVPFLSQLPLLGWLFKQQAVRDNKRELLIFVTPNIITQTA